MIEHLALLMAHDDFKKQEGIPFTIVLHKYAEHRRRIEQVIAPHGGSLILDEGFIVDKFEPVLDHMAVHFARHMAGK